MTDQPRPAPTGSSDVPAVDLFKRASDGRFAPGGRGGPGRSPGSINRTSNDGRILHRLARRHALSRHPGQERRRLLAALDRLFIENPEGYVRAILGPPERGAMLNVNGDVKIIAASWFPDWAREALSQPDGEPRPSALPEPDGIHIESEHARSD